MGEITNFNCVKILQSHIVPEQTTAERLSEYARPVFADFIPSRKGIKKAIKKGWIRINGAPSETGHWVRAGEQIDLIEAPSAPRPVFRLALEVIYEDESIALINKPAGFPVSGNAFKTIEGALPYNLKPSTAKDSLATPQPVHRLDHPTSGLLLVAKTRSARIHLGDQFEKQSIQKRYQAVVIGELSGSGHLKTSIGEKASHTEYRCRRIVPSLRSGHLSVLELIPHTGRTHQLRIHLSGAGFPILGDRLYGKEGLILKGKGLFLCATALTFQHPERSVPMHFQIPPAQKFITFPDREARRWQKYAKKQGNPKNELPD